MVHTGAHQDTSMATSLRGNRGTRYCYREQKAVTAPMRWLMGCSGCFHQKPNIYNPPLLSEIPPLCRKDCCVGLIRRNGFYPSPAETSYARSRTQALSSSGALPFVSFLLPSSPAPTAASVNSLVLFSALLPERKKQPPRKSTSAS